MFGAIIGGVTCRAAKVYMLHAIREETFLSEQIEYDYRIILINAV